MASPGPGKAGRAGAGALALWLAWAASAAPARAAGDPVLARVLSVEPGRVTLTVEDAGGGTARRIAVPLEGAAPPAIAPGALVRVWPGATTDADGLWSGAQMVPLGRDLGGADRTGVRSRLLYGAKRGFGGGHGGR